MERVYPRLRLYCQERGYQFQVVDMRWGISDESTNDHMATELCLQEITNCQQLSTGPNFVVSIANQVWIQDLCKGDERNFTDSVQLSCGDEEILSLKIGGWGWGDTYPSQILDCQQVSNKHLHMH